MNNDIDKLLHGLNHANAMPRRDVLAAALAGGVAALLPSAVLSESAAAAAAGAKSASGLMPWSHYIDLLRPAGELIQQTWAPKSDQQRADLYRQLLMNISQGYFMYFQSDADHPDWAPLLNSVFLLQPNPDAVYYWAPVRGDGIYRVRGQRGDSPVVGFATGNKIIGTADPPGRGFNNYDVDRLKLTSDGSFDVIFSANRPRGYAGDWRHLHPDADFLLLRQFSYDWGRERDAKLAIERMDRPALKPTMSVDTTDRQMRELLGGYVARLTRQWLVYQNAMRDKGLVNKVELTRFEGMGNSSEWPQVYWQCVYDLQPHEALIIESELPEKRHYWNVQVADWLWNQVELVYRQSSLNGHQAKVDSDGKFRAVLSLEDPGIHNWLDTGGNIKGSLIGRWYRCSSHPTPTVKKVALADIRKHLPKDTPVITPEERAAALAERRLGAQLRRRW